MSKEKIGFVGLGMMGLPMAKNLVDGSYKVTVFDLAKSTIKTAESFGCIPKKSGAEVAEVSDIIITMVPDSHHVETAIVGTGGIIEGISNGSILIDMSTISPHTSKKMATLLSEKGAGFIDAPVTGGVMGAEAATLSILVGGDSEHFERVLPVLKVLGANVTHMGSVGSGHTAKIANQILGAATLAGISEALVLAKKSGLNLQTFFDAASKGAGQSWYLDNYGPKILAGDFTPGFMVKHMQKDLRLAEETAALTGTSIPTTSLVAQLYRSIQSEGPNAVNQGHQSLVKTIEKLSNDQARL
ncbi:MAG: NAD(P)-dependent oxidoreductase [Dehalococcoidia bacterium]|nr:NAD(P)-dependent oxidoreductase [Dehalococcoidia bacterium]